MGSYHLFIPVLFNIIKGHNDTVSVKDFEKYLKASSQSNSPFIALLKEHISPASNHCVELRNKGTQQDS